MREQDAARVPFIGVTGGIGAGKSEALAALERLGVATLSSDAVVHELLATDEVRELLVERLGPGVAPRGAVDRAAVAQAVFDSPDQREWLERTLWPRVGSRVSAWRAELTHRERPPRAAAVEVPLLFEAGMERLFDWTVAVLAPDSERSERSAGRGHAAVEARSARQLSQAEKSERASFVVHNDGGVDLLDERMAEILATIGT